MNQQWLYEVLLIATLPMSVLAGDNPSPVSQYHADTRTLFITLGGRDRFQYVFNKGGAIKGVYDLKIAPTNNLIGESYQGETTDRVIQWTYWNSRYEGSPHKEGDGDVRANATMEGCFHEAGTCEVLSSPPSGETNTLVFRSRLQHWFYISLDRHGKPDFETTSTYEVLSDGSLKLTRAVLMRPWKLKDVYFKVQEGKTWTREKISETTLKAEHVGHKSLTSYFEGWTPLRRTVLPRQKHAKGEFKDDGYKFWKPQDLGGWAMACSDELAMAVVFGKTEFGDRRYKVQSVFNKLDWPKDNLNVLMPAVNTDWPDNSTLTQTLIFVVGAPGDVAKRADALVDTVPVPTISKGD